MRARFTDITDLRNAFAFAYGLAHFPDDGDENEGDGGTDDDENEGVQASADDKGDEKKGKGDWKSLSKEEQDKKLTTENAKLRIGNRELQARLKEIEDRDKSDLDRLTETANLVPQLQQQNQDLIIENAILKACDSHEVRDRELVQMLVAKNSHLKFEDGEVIGIDEAFDDVKQKKPLLFGRAEENGSSEEDKNKTQPGANGASGRATQGNKASNGPDVETLRQKFPALRR